jgi:hypothetical protein
MSVKLTSNAILNTAGNQFASGYNAASVSFFFRYDGPVTSASGGVVEHAFTPFNFSAGLRDSTHINGDGFWTGADSNTSEAGVPLLAGTVYHIVLTYALGSQKLYVNGVPYAMTPSLNEAIQTATFYGIYIGDQSGSGTTNFSIRDLALWGGYTLSQSEVASIRDGTSPATIGGGAAFRIYWSLATPGKNPGDVVSIGDSGLSDVLGQTSLAFNGITPGSGAVVYNDAMAFVPGATITAAVGSSGRSIYVKCLDLSSNWAQETSYIAEPTISINGGAPYSLGTSGVVPIRDPYNIGMLYTLPSGMQIAASDVVTLSAPQGAYGTAAGITAAATNIAVTNCVGRSFFGGDSLSRTLKMGFVVADNGFLDSAENAMTKNYVPRAYAGSAFGLSGSWWQTGPTAITTSPASVLVTTQTFQDNGIDQTGVVGGPAGLWAVRWDDTGSDIVHHPTVLSLDTPEGTTAERTDLQNSGISGAGQVRVFNLQPPASGNIGMSVGLKIAQDQLTPHLANVAIYGPGDFTYTNGVPVVIPAPTLGDVTANMKSRLPTCGAIRWVDAVLGYDTTNAYAPEHIEPASDWSYQGYQKIWSFGCTQIRPWNPSVSPYIFSHLFGESYTCTLSPGQSLDAPATGTIESIHIADASASVTLGGTGPIFAGQTLVNGSEKIRVISIDPSDGTLVTVERGSVGTTPQALAAGSTLTVNYRHHPSATIQDYVGGNPTGIWVVEVVTNGRHNLVDGNNPTKSGGWPTITFTDGGVYNPSGGGEVCLVTGPNTFLNYWGYAPGANATTANTYTLNPSTNTCVVVVPEGPNAPYGVQIPVNDNLGADHWITIPPLASDAYVYKVAQIFLGSRVGSRKWIELANETWNQTYTAAQIFTHFDRLVGFNRQVPSLFGTVVRRTGQIRQIFKQVFNAASRGNEIYAGCNVQVFNSDAVYQGMSQAVSEGLPIDAFYHAPYWAMNHEPTVQVPIMHTREMDLVCDMAMFKLNCLWTPQTASLPSNYAEDTSPYLYVYGFGDGNSGFRTMIDKWNAANASWNSSNLTAGSVRLCAYEAGPGVMYYRVADSVHNSGGMDNVTTSLVVGNAAQFSVGMYLLVDPSTSGDFDGFQAWCFNPTRSEWVKVTAVNTGTNTLTVLRGQSGTTAKSHAAGVGVRAADIELARDLVYHPNYRLVEKEYYAIFQRGGYDVACLQSLDKFYFGYIQHWGMYHGEQQPPGLGDGTDGKANNLACLAAPGSGQKSATVNQDKNNVSVRGQALLEWNQPAGTPPPPKPPRKHKIVIPSRYR